MLAEGRNAARRGTDEEVRSGPRYTAADADQVRIEYWRVFDDIDADPGQAAVDHAPYWAACAWACARWASSHSSGKFGIFAMCTSRLRSFTKRPS